MQCWMPGTFSKMNVYTCLAVLFEVSSIFGLSVLTGSDSQNTTYSIETVREVKNFDVLRQLLNQETLIRMSMAKDMQSFLGDMSTLKQTTAELKEDLQKLERENERLSNENVKCSENFNLVLGNSDEMNKTIDRLRDELKQSKQNLSSAVSSLGVLQMNSRDEMNKTIDRLRGELKQSRQNLSSAVSYLGVLQMNGLDEMNKTIDRLRDDLTRSKQKLSSAVSSLRVLQTDSREQKMKVGFTAGITSPDSDFEGSIIRFPKVLYTAGGGYDSSTGIFTAPVSGHFVFFTVSYSKANNLATDIVKDGSSKVRADAYNSGDATAYQTGTNMVLMYLHKGDRVWIKRTDGEGYHSESTPIMTFSGFKI